uniref:Light-inducible protein CPRF2-like isoform X2 n=1 Tax=Rhizophora mucronata TaxID=61149 RepID=A0A2P2MSB1_RHIMU
MLPNKHFYNLHVDAHTHERMGACVHVCMHAREFSASDQKAWQILGRNLGWLSVFEDPHKKMLSN